MPKYHRKSDPLHGSEVEVMWEESPLMFQFQTAKVCETFDEYVEAAGCIGPYMRVRFVEKDGITEAFEEIVPLSRIEMRPGC